MFEKAKQFVKDHKYEIIAGATVTAAGVVVGMAISNKVNKNFIETGKMLRGQRVISWFGDPDVGFMNLERVKSILDANVDNHSRFAIFREGINSDEYICLMLSDDIVFPEVA